MVTVMAVTTVFFATKQYNRNSGNNNFGEAVVNITVANMSEPHKFNGTSRDNVVYEIDNVIVQEQEVRETNEIKKVL